MADGYHVWKSYSPYTYIPDRTPVPIRPPSPPSTHTTRRGRTVERRPDAKAAGAGEQQRVVVWLSDRAGAPPSVPPAPGLLSTMTCWPSAADKRCAISSPITSAGPRDDQCRPWVAAMRDTAAQRALVSGVRCCTSDLKRRAQIHLLKNVKSQKNKCKTFSHKIAGPLRFDAAHAW